MKYHQTNDTLLRRVLLANAAFSAATGLAALFAAKNISAFLFAMEFTVWSFPASTLIFELGIGLLIFAALVLLVARQKTLRLGWVKAIIAADLLWVVDSALLLALYPQYFSPMGFEAMVIVAIIVLVFALDQGLGLALMYQGKSRVDISRRDGETVITASLDTTAAAERVWQIMSHQESYAEVADNLSKAEIVDGEGEGMIRQCWDTKGKSWKETCTRWVEGQAFAFRVHTEASDYPYPIAALAGEWSLSPLAHGAEVKMTFTVQPKPGVVNQLLFKLMAAQFAAICDRLLRRWVEIMEGKSGTKPKNRPLKAITSSR